MILKTEARGMKKKAADGEKRRKNFKRTQIRDC